MSETVKYSILLGGCGGDSHSVGLTILKKALELNGYEVLYLGIQNSLKTFFEYQYLANAILISSMDGHSEYYLKEFPQLKSEFPSGDSSKCWYLGGNLSIDDSIYLENKFIEMGFKRVFPKFVDVESFLEMLKYDLFNSTPIPNAANIFSKLGPVFLSKDSPMLSTDDKVPTSDFHKERRLVLQHWKTGKNAENLEENATFLKGVPSFTQKQQKANLNKYLLTQPRSGVALKEAQINYFQHFKSFGADVLSYQVDSLTRNNNYVGAEEQIKNSLAYGVSSLNGFPLINHGVNTLREIISTVPIPLQTRHSTKDPRLLAEISHAGGVTAFEGGAICYNIPYYKNYPLSEAIKNWQYVDRLMGIYYDEYGIAIDREYFGVLTATLIPPCIAISTNILESILALQQGVKSVSLGYAEQGNRNQDIAAIRAMKEISSDIFSKLGYKDIQINTIFHQYMAAFPFMYDKAEELIYQSAISAKLSGATRILSKTPVEAIKVPSMAENLAGINLVKKGIEDAKLSINTFNEITIQAEIDIIKKEVYAIIESVFSTGGGQLSKGIVKAFNKGYIDIPFSPSLFNRGEVLTVRDNDNAIRIGCMGKMQFPKELIDFHKEKVQERLKKEGNKKWSQLYSLVEKDVLKIARAQYEKWPLY